jgi:hypothetical protein
VQTKTPPELKWLLVERATLAGNIVALEKSRVHLKEEIARFQARVDALDTTMRCIERSINVQAAGTIHGHKPQYGKRGALREFIIAMLKDASPDSASTTGIAYALAAHFKLDFASKADLRSFVQGNVKRALLRLKEQGLVEALHGKGGPQQVGIWRWKDSLPTLAELAALSSS